MSTDTIILSGEQQTALEKIMEWLKGDKRELKLGGYAGTGKTTLIRALQEELETIEDLNYAVAAFTGKAVSVLKKKGVKRTSTLHALMYLVKRSHGQIYFERLAHLPVSLVIVDEASMISQILYEDLMSFEGLKVLWIGDHGQLEPMGDNPFIMRDPDIRLEKIHRQAEGSMILRLAEAVRMGKRFRHGVYQMVEVASLNKFWVSLDKVDQVIVGFNRTRHEVNKILRQHYGFNNTLLSVGEKVVCLQNNRKYNVYNGLTIKVTRVDDVDSETLVVDLEDENQVWRGIPTLKRQLGRNKSQNEAFDKEKCYFDYGYALTAHKSQGSEWKSVLVYEQIASQWDPRRWRYTVMTRAVERLIYCC